MAECKKFKVGREFMNEHNWPANLCNPKYDRCYCKLCYSDEMKDFYVVAGKSYVVPRGWTRFGVQMDEAIAKHHNIWENWAHCYHGTSIESATSIIEHRQMLLPGEMKMDGEQISIRRGHIPGQNFYFTTPTIKYAEHRAYASSYTFTSSNKRQYNIKVVLQCKQKPDSFTVQAETVGANKRICEFIPNDQVEWKTQVRLGIMPYGLLLSIEPIRSSSLEVLMLGRKISPWDYIEVNPFGMALRVSVRIDCPHCYHPNVFENPEKNQGMVITCENRHCNVIFKAYNCPYCSHLHSICECRLRFSAEGEAPCWNKNCNETILSLKCPDCPAFNFCKSPKDGQSVLYKCYGKACKKTCQVYDCPHCHYGYMQNDVIGKDGLIATCRKPECKKTFQLVTCPHCINVNVSSKPSADKVIKCAYKGCNMKFKQPVLPTRKECALNYR